MVLSPSVIFPPVWTVKTSLLEAHRVGDAPVRHHLGAADRLHCALRGAAASAGTASGRRDQDGDARRWRAARTCVVTFVPFCPPEAAVGGAVPKLGAVCPPVKLSVCIWGAPCLLGATVCPSAAPRRQPRGGTRVIRKEDRARYDPRHERQRLGDRLAGDRVEDPDRRPALAGVVGDQGPARARAGGRRRRLARPRSAPASAPAPAAAPAPWPARRTGAAAASARSGRVADAAAHPSVAFGPWRASTSREARLPPGRCSCRRSASCARTSPSTRAATRLVGAISIVLVVGAIGTAIYLSATEEHEPKGEHAAGE